MKTNRSSHFFSGMVLLAMGAGMLGAGCQHMGNYELPARSIPQPVGTQTNVIMQVQATKAEREDFYVYLYEWVPGAVTLNATGQRHVSSLVSRIGSEPFPIVIETSEDAGLDSQRQEALAEYLAVQGIGDANDIVVVQRITPSTMTPGEGADIAHSLGMDR